LSPQLVIRGRVARRILEGAERLGITPDEYLLELVTQGLDLRDRAVEYVGTARELIEEAGEELGKGNIRQAAEKIWGAAALAVKAYAYWRDDKRLSSHGELWGYMRVLARDMGAWVRETWMYANGVHTCFYEGWCAKDDVEDAYKRIEKLVGEVAFRIGNGNR